MTPTKEQIYAELKVRCPSYDNIIDAVFGAAMLENWEYNGCELLVKLAKAECIEQICESMGIRPPYKDGNAWCVLLGEDLQSGICGFGDSPQTAFTEFLKELSNRC